MRSRRLSPRKESGRRKRGKALFGRRCVCAASVFGFPAPLLLVLLPRHAQNASVKICQMEYLIGKYATLELDGS